MLSRLDRHRRFNLMASGPVRMVMLAFALLASAVPARAQPAPKVTRIGVLTLSTATWTQEGEAFRQGLRDLGYVEGRNIRLEHRDAAGRADRLPILAVELVHLNVDIIVTQSNVAALAAKQVTQTIPIVMAIAGDPVKAGVASSLASPGGNVTGLTLMQTELSRKRLQLLREAAPSTAVVAVLWNPTDPAAADFLRETEAAAQSLGLKIHAIEARSATELYAAFKAVTDLHPSAFLTLPGGMFQANVRRIVDFAAKRRLPGVFPNRAFVEAGGLLSYAPSLAANWRRAAVFVDKILKGAKPGDLPIEQPTEFELVLNVKTAKALGLTIPPTLLARADEIIQ
jgi:putative tryptophan/tyrosine transport system substrate-binding protein